MVVDDVGIRCVSVSAHLARLLMFNTWGWSVVVRLLVVNIYLLSSSGCGHGTAFTNVGVSRAYYFISFLDDCKTPCTVFVMNSASRYHLRTIAMRMTDCWKRGLTPNLTLVSRVIVCCGESACDLTEVARYSDSAD